MWLVLLELLGGEKISIDGGYGKIKGKLLESRIWVMKVRIQSIIFSPRWTKFYLSSYHPKTIRNREKTCHC